MFDFAPSANPKHALLRIALALGSLRIIVILDKRGFFFGAQYGHRRFVIAIGVFGRSTLAHKRPTAKSRIARFKASNAPKFTSDDHQDNKFLIHAGQIGQLVVGERIAMSRHEKPIIEDSQPTVLTITEANNEGDH